MARMYRDPKRWAYLFQSYVLLTMMEAHETPQTKRLRVLERSVYSARYCFIENLRTSFSAFSLLARPPLLCCLPLLLLLLLLLLILVLFRSPPAGKSEPPLIDDLEYEVYKKWFAWLMERCVRSAPLPCFRRQLLCFAFAIY
jgi:hypothetical protein